MQYLLIIDTSLSGLALARVRLTANAYAIDQQFICAQKRATERLLATHTQALLAQTPQLARVVVSIGPGSFTGIRIGIAFASGLAMFPQKLLGISSLHAIASHLTVVRHAPVQLYHAITANSGVVAYSDGDTIKLANVNLPVLPATTDKTQVLIAGDWPRLATQLGDKAAPSCGRRIARPCPCKH